MTMNTNQFILWRAVLEAIAGEYSEIAERSRRAGTPIDKIISLGDATFRFITFATSINEDMIVITSSTKSSTDEVYKKRILFGLKKSGRYYFENNDGEETPFISLIAEYSYPKLQSESCFLFYTDVEKIMGKDIYLVLQQEIALLKFMIYKSLIQYLFLLVLPITHEQ